MASWWDKSHMEHQKKKIFFMYSGRNSLNWFFIRDVRMDPRLSQCSSVCCEMLCEIMLIHQCLTVEVVKTTKISVSWMVFWFPWVWSECFVYTSLVCINAYENQCKTFQFCGKNVWISQNQIKLILCICSLSSKCLRFCPVWHEARGLRKKTSVAHLLLSAQLQLCSSDMCLFALGALHYMNVLKWINNCC